MVSHLNSFRYIEMDGEFIETPFQHFEEVPPTLASAETVVEEDFPLKMASLKDSRAVIEKGTFNFAHVIYECLLLDSSAGQDFFVAIKP